MAEKEYIEREAAIDAVKKERNYTGKFTFEEEHAWAVGFQQGITFALSDIAAIHAADVRPVVRGKWIQTTQPMGWRDEDCAECSVCGEDFVLDEWAMDEFTNLMNFCPNCGADMRGEQDV